MLRIPNINPEMIDRYGRHFFKLVMNAKEAYTGMTGGADFDKPVDPNHQNVVEISSEGEDDGDGQVAYFEDEEEPEASYLPSSQSSIGERSNYFVPDPAVAEFNEQGEGKKFDRTFDPDLTM